MTTRQEISDWFDRGRDKGDKYMLVICDTFDHEDYPVYADSADVAREKKVAAGSMQKVMEIYDLSADRDDQLSQHRCFAI